MVAGVARRARIRMDARDENRFDDYGIKLEVRDANFKSDVQLQAVSELIDEHPDVLIVQNPNVTLLAKELKRAMDAGIYVVQVNMASNTLTDAYVGVTQRTWAGSCARHHRPLRRRQELR